MTDADRRRPRDESSPPAFVTVDKKQRLSDSLPLPTSRSPSPSPSPSPIPLRSPQPPHSHQSTLPDSDDGHTEEHAIRRRIDARHGELPRQRTEFDSSSDEEEDELLASSSSSPPPARPAEPFGASFLTGCRSVFTSYTRLNTISSGTYGVVHRARSNSPPHAIVALKKIKLEDAGGFPVTALREINILLSVRHANIVAVHEVVVGRNNDSVYMVMQYAEHDLKHLLTTHAPPHPPPFRTPHIKRLVHELLSALAYLHGRFLLHRDVKTSNLLYSHPSPSAPPVLLLADFGLARPYGLPLAAYTPTVVTLWYRAPELLMGASLYGPAVDVFSAGCVMAELLRNGKPMWPGKGELDQLGRLMDVMGGLDEHEQDDVMGHDKTKRGWRLAPGGRKEGRLRQLFPPSSHLAETGLSDTGYGLLRGMLELNPKRRLTAEQALSSPWFDEEPRMERPDRMPRFASANESSDRTVQQKPETVHERAVRAERDSRFHM